MFAGEISIDIKILTYLSLPDLLSIFQVSKKLLVFDLNSNLWIEKIKYDFGSAFLISKLSHIQSKELYLTLEKLEFTIGEAINLARNGKLLELKLLDIKGVSPTFQVANEASLNGQLEVLSWCVEKEIYPALYRASDTRTIEWLKERDILPGTGKIDHLLLGPIGAVGPLGVIGPTGPTGATSPLDPIVGPIGATGPIVGATGPIVGATGPIVFMEEND